MDLFRQLLHSAAAILLQDLQNIQIDLIHFIPPNFIRPTERFFLRLKS